MKRAIAGILTGSILLSTAGIAYAAGIGRAYVPSEANTAGPGVNMDMNFGENVENPVKYIGYIKDIDKDNSRLMFSSSVYELNEQGKYVERKQELVLNTGDETLILDAVSGLPVEMDKIDKNAPAYAWTDPAMTRSIPPQTSARIIVVNIPADFPAPMYVVVNELEKDEEGNVIITDQDGNRFAVASNIEIKPYLTRNIVGIDDIEKGRGYFVWIGPAVALSYPPLYFAEKIMLLPV